MLNHSVVSQRGLGMLPMMVVGISGVFIKLLQKQLLR